MPWGDQDPLTATAIKNSQKTVDSENFYRYVDKKTQCTFKYLPLLKLFRDETTDTVEFKAIKTNFIFGFVHQTLTYYFWFCKERSDLLIFIKSWLPSYYKQFENDLFSNWFSKEKIGRRLMARINCANSCRCVRAALIQRFPNWRSVSFPSNPI